MLTAGTHTYLTEPKTSVLSLVTRVSNIHTDHSCSMHTHSCFDRSVYERWKLRSGDGGGGGGGVLLSAEEAADRSLVPTGITLFAHIKSFLNVDSREQSTILSVRLSQSPHNAPAPHLQNSDHIHARYAPNGEQITANRLVLVLSKHSLLYQTGAFTRRHIPVEATSSNDGFKQPFRSMCHISTLL